MRHVRITAAYVTGFTKGYVAHIEELPNVFAQGDTIEETRRNLLAAMDVWLTSNRRVTHGTFGRPVAKRETIAIVRPAPVKDR